MDGWIILCTSLDSDCRSFFFFFEGCLLRPRWSVLHRYSCSCSVVDESLGAMLRDVTLRSVAPDYFRARHAFMLAVAANVTGRARGVH